ncbi:NAD(P)H nitroreductase [Actinomycetospora endophytica]|uniref:NAD(P)H nitroreductase n=1 Tax=Actinomycetospora endophytica TaxID=2291215 RepID=A0ABS8PC12_9PSEU|nr:NAD(P)H nitroreductase [Actinomycetospora endophytica]MCD2195831.1 NAD(P)H nitroreductase [Actinomycetospora endophytica]
MRVEGTPGTDVDGPTDRELLRGAVGLAGLAPSEHNTQPWRWRLHDDVLDLRADRTRRLPSTDEGARSVLLGCGCALHHLEVALAAAGRRVEVRRGSDEDPEHPLARIRLGGAADPDPRTARWFAAIPTRRTDRRRFSAREVGTDAVERLVDAARPYGGTVHLAVGATRQAVLDAARDADLAQRGHLDYAGELQHWTHRSAGDHDGIPATSRPGTPAAAYGDMAVRWMPAGTLDQPRSGLDVRDSSQLLLIAVPSDDTVSLVRAGEALSAVLLEAESLGLGVTPFAQPFEVPETRARVRQLALGRHRVPAIALRIGRRRPDAPGIPPTPRRPLQAVLTEEPVGTSVGSTRARRP